LTEWTFKAFDLKWNAVMLIKCEEYEKKESKQWLKKIKQEAKQSKFKKVEIGNLNK